MASVLYPSAKEAILNKLIDLDTDDIRAILIDEAVYTYSAAHEFLDDVPAGARVAVTAAALPTRSLTGGTFDSGDFLFTSVTGAPCGAIILYLHTGTEGTSRLITRIHGFSVTPDGNDINVTVDAAGIFSLADA